VSIDALALLLAAITGAVAVGVLCFVHLYGFVPVWVAITLYAAYNLGIQIAHDRHYRDQDRDQ
jgi:uncharacterized protein (DUF983 family)